MSKLKSDRSNDLTIQRSNDPTIQLLLASLVMLTLAGCSRSVASAPTDNASSVEVSLLKPISLAPKLKTVDAGVVFSDRSSYLCLPLDQVGLNASANIVSISASCKCVLPSIIQVKLPRNRSDDDLSNQTGKAILLRFVPETFSDALETSSVMMKTSSILETPSTGAKIPAMQSEVKPATYETVEPVSLGVIVTCKLSDGERTSST